MARFVFALWSICMKILNALSGAVEQAIELVNGIRPGYDYKGSVATRTDLPEDPTTGDLYTITDEDELQVAWNGTAWITPGYPAITNAQIDALFEE